MAATLRFTVDMTGQCMEIFERVFVFGNVKELGAWNADKALKLSRTDDYNEWVGEASLPVTAKVLYRYFVGAMNRDKSALQVRRWESHSRARERKITGRDDTCSDKFGCIDGGECQVRRGWLNTGQIVLFKLLRTTLPTTSEQQRVQLRLEAVDPCTREPILPSPTAHIHYTLLRYGNSYLREQPHYGVSYKPDDILIFQITTLNKKNVAYLFKLFACDREKDCACLLRKVFVPPRALKSSAGEFFVTFGLPNSNSDEATTMKVDYLVISPMAQWHLPLNATFVDHWPINWPTFDIGHRGMGRSFVEENAASLPENTIGSMIECFNSGADFVEFDVMVTKDLVPVVYHDYDVKVCDAASPPSSESDLKLRLIKDLTYEELRSLTTYKTIGGRIVAYPAANTVDNENERLFPTLADFCTKTNKMLGFNIEIKWPQVLHDDSVESKQTIDKNQFIDSILEVVRRFGWGRVCIFSSFDVDTCIMLRYKQNLYPVFLLVPNTYPCYADPRTHCLHPAINTAQAFELDGVAPSVNMFERHPETVMLVQRQNKLIMLWGDELCDRASINQYRQGVNAVIYDRLELVLDSGKESYFVQDTEIKQLLSLQLLCPCNGSNS